MTPAPAERPGWLVRIRRSVDAAPVGAGVLATDRHVVTCAHVVSPGASAPDGPVFVELQFASAHEPIPARVVDGGWHPAGPDGSGDVAVLALEGPLPPEAEPAPLRESAGTEDHPFRAYGYPRGHERNGVWSHGVVVGPAEVEWIQLEAGAAQGFSLLQGFSGGPVYDEASRAVVGIVVSTDREADVRTGYAIPLEVVEGRWEGLAPWVGWRLSHDPAMASHWGPRARGVERDSRPGWYFTGRRQVLVELVDWLERAPADGNVRVVTGGPGSGKSAVLARLAALADPAWRARVEREDPGQLADPATVASVGRIGVAVHAAGLDLGEVVCRIAEAVSGVAEDPDALIAHLRMRGRPTVVMVDALDEAVSSAEARAIATRLLVPLARDAAGVGTKVLVGTRPGPEEMFLRALGARATVLDLDDSRYVEVADLARYAELSLTLASEPAAASPYRDDPEATRVVARAIAEAAFPSYLVAGLTARAQAEERAILDVSSPGWRKQASFPADVDMAMADYLDRLEDPQRAFDLLVPVAYAHYPGLPRDTLWAPLAEAYSGQAYGPADLDWLLATAAAFLLEETDQAGTGLVRLFHRALVDHVRSRTQASMVERAISDVLATRAVAAGGWLEAERYARSHAAGHAARAGGGLLDRLVADPAFLVAAERRELLRALPSLVAPEALRVAGCYRAAAAHLTGDVAADAAYLELASRIEGHAALADGVRALGQPQPFTTSFGRRRPTDDPLPETGHTGGIRALTWGTLGGAPVLASGGDDGTVRVWDPATGTQLRVLDGRGGGLWAVVWGEVEGRPVVASAGVGGAIRLWDPATGTEQRTLDGHTGGVWGLAWGACEGDPVLVSGGVDGTIRLWDPATGTRLRVLEGHTAGVWAVAWGACEGEPALVSAGFDGTIRLWDPLSGAQLRVLEGHAGGVRAVAWGTIDGRPVLASSGFDRTMRLWDPVDGSLLRVLEEQAGWVGTVAWGTLDGAPVLASVNDDFTLRLWDPGAGVQTRVLEGHTAWVWSAAWGALDGRPVLASAGDDGVIRLWNPATGTQLRVLEGRTNQIWGVAWGAFDGATTLATASADGTLRLWDPADGAQLRVLEGPPGWVLGVAWGTLDGAPALAEASFDGTVRVWDPVAGRELHVLEGHAGTVRGVAWGELDGAPLLASAGFDGTVRVWDPVAGRALHVLEGHAGTVRAVAWGELDGAPLLASAGFDGTLRLWDPATGAQAGVVDAHSGTLWAVAWGMFEGRPALVSAGDDGTVRLWDPPTGTELARLGARTGWVGSIAWGTLGGTPVLVSGGADGAVWLWDPASERVAVIGFGSGPVFTASFSPEGWLGVAAWEGLAVVVPRPEMFANPQTALPGPLARSRLRRS